MGGLIKFVLVIAGLAAVVAVGGYFALKRADIPYETLASRYESAASRYVDLPSGVHMHYRDQGLHTAPVIVLIHGYSLSLDTWEQWVARLGDSYRVISIDLPGHGLTRAPAGYRASIEVFRDVVGEFARTQGLTHFTIAGNSMGGDVAWEYALAHPEQVDALVLIDAAGWPPRPDFKEPSFFALLRNPTIGPLLRDLDNTNFFKKGLPASFADPALATDTMITRSAELSRAPGHRDILLQLMLASTQRNFATKERLAAIRAPTLILFGAEDHLVPPSDGERFHDAIAGSELVMLEHAGHLPQEEKTEESASALRAFLHAHHLDAEPAAAAAAR